jgi:hypothetical protein
MKAVDERPAVRIVPALQAVVLVLVWVVLWLGFARSDLPGIPPLVDASVAVGVALLAGVIMVWSWRRVGGYRNNAALHHWVRGGPKPSNINATTRLRYLKSAASKSTGRGWLYVALGCVWILLAILQSFGNDSHRFGFWGVGAIWLFNGGSEVFFIRRWGGRAADLVRESRADVEAGELGTSPESQKI